MGANTVALITRQDRITRNREGETMADEAECDTGERELASVEVEKHMTMSETTPEIEMGAAASNDQSNQAQLCQLLCVDHGTAGDGSGSKGRSGTFPAVAVGTGENPNQPPGI